MCIGNTKQKDTKRTQDDGSSNIHEKEPPKYSWCSQSLWNIYGNWEFSRKIILKEKKEKRDWDTQFGGD